MQRSSFALIAHLILPLAPRESSRPPFNYCSLRWGDCKKKKGKKIFDLILKRCSRSLRTRRLSTLLVIQRLWGECVFNEYFIFQLNGKSHQEGVDKALDSTGTYACDCHPDQGKTESIYLSLPSSSMRAYTSHPCSCVDVFIRWGLNGLF